MELLQSPVYMLQEVLDSPHASNSRQLKFHFFVYITCITSHVYIFEKLLSHSARSFAHNKIYCNYA